MKFTREQVEAAHARMRRRGHCGTRGCDCSYCVAAHALRVYLRLGDLIEAHRQFHHHSYDDVQWFSRLENLERL